MLWRKIKHRGEMVFAGGRIKRSDQKILEMYNPMISIYIWRQDVELRSSKEASIPEFFHLVAMENLLASTFCLRHCRGLRLYLEWGKFCLNSVLFFAWWLPHLNSALSGVSFLIFECRELWMIDLEPFCCLD